MASPASTQNQVSEGTTSAQRILREVPADPLTYRYPRTREEVYGTNCPIEQPAQKNDTSDLGDKVALVAGLLGMFAVLLLQALGCIR